MSETDAFWLAIVYLVILGTIIFFGIAIGAQSRRSGSRRASKRLLPPAQTELPSKSPAMLVSPPVPYSPKWIVGHVKEIYFEFPGVQNVPTSRIVIETKDVVGARSMELGDHVVVSPLDKNGIGNAGATETHN
jgi:hypothetical protein